MGRDQNTLRAGNASQSRWRFEESYSASVFLSIFNINIRSYWYLHWITHLYWKYIEYWLLNLIYRALTCKNRALRSFKIRPISHQYRQRSDPWLGVVFNCSTSCVCSRVLATTSIAISLPPAIIWLLNRLFKHSIRSIFVLLSFTRYHIIVQWPPKKARLASTDIDGMD